MTCSARKSPFTVDTVQPEADALTSVSASPMTTVPPRFAKSCAYAATKAPPSSLQSEMARISDSVNLEDSTLVRVTIDRVRKR